MVVLPDAAKPSTVIITRLGITLIQLLTAQPPLPPVTLTVAVGVTGHAYGHDQGHWGKGRLIRYLLQLSLNP